MKKLNYLVLVAAMAFVFVGCRKPVEVSFSSTTQEINPMGGSIEMALKSNGEWTINSTSGWITISPMSGKGDATLTFVAEANATGEERTAEIKAITKDNTATLIVIQGAAVQPPQYYLTVTPKEFQCGSAGGEFIVTVSSNMDWAVTAPQWISCSETNGSNNATITLTVNPIDGEIIETREADVLFSGSNASDKVHVIQSIDPVLGMEISPKNLDFVCSGETKTVVISTEDAWVASVGADWVALNQLEGQGNAEISVTVGENPVFEQRQTTVLFTTHGGIQALLSISQEASPDPHFLEVSPHVFQFGKEGGDKEISVECDTDWVFDLECDWLVLSQQSGTGNATVVLSAEPNVYSEPRTRQFNIKSGELSAQFIVSQEAGDEPIMASFEPDTLFVAYTGGVHTLDVTSNTTWQLQASSWIILQTSYGEGNASINIIVDVNQSSEGRMGFVTAFHNGQELATMVVAQEGKTYILETDITELDVRPEGGSYEIQVISNQSWAANADVNWIHYEPQSGFGNKTLTVTVDPMMGVRPRTGYIKLSGESGNQVIITVNQHQ